MCCNIATDLNVNIDEDIMNTPTTNEEYPQAKFIFEFNGDIKLSITRANNISWMEVFQEILDGKYGTFLENRLNEKK